MRNLALAIVLIMRSLADVALLLLCPPHGLRANKLAPAPDRPCARWQYLQQVTVVAWQRCPGCGELAPAGRPHWCRR